MLLSRVLSAYLWHMQNVLTANPPNSTFVRGKYCQRGGACVGKLEPMSFLLTVKEIQAIQAMPCASCAAAAPTLPP